MNRRTLKLVLATLALFIGVAASSDRSHTTGAAPFCPPFCRPGVK